MFILLHFLFDRFDRFQSWFDHRFGWFFTNGMKQQRPKNLFAISPFEASAEDLAIGRDAGTGA